MLTSPPLWAVRLSVSNKLQRTTQSECHCRPAGPPRVHAVGTLSKGIVTLPIRFTRVVIASAPFTLNDHIGQPSPIDANNEFGLTMAATENRRINGVASKCDGAVGGGVDEAPFRVAFDNAEKNSTLHATLPEGQAVPASFIPRHCSGWRARSGRSVERPA